MRLFYRALVFGLLFAFVFTLFPAWEPTQFRNWEDFAQDLAVRLSGPDKRIEQSLSTRLALKVIAADENEFERWGKPSQFPRKVLADVLHQVAQLGPDVLIIDFDMSRAPLDVEADKELKTAISSLLESASETHLIVNGDSSTNTQRGWLRAYFGNAIDEGRITIASPLAFVSASDGLVRSFKPSLRSNTGVRQSIAAVACAKLLDDTLCSQGGLERNTPLFFPTRSVLERFDDLTLTTAEAAELAHWNPERPSLIIVGAEYNDGNSVMTTRGLMTSTHFVANQLLSVIAFEFVQPSMLWMVAVVLLLTILFATLLFRCERGSFVWTIIVVITFGFFVLVRPADAARLLAAYSVLSPALAMIALYPILKWIFNKMNKSKKGYG